MGTLVCTIEMDKNDGLTVTIANGDANITQTIKMNGTTIELKVVAESATSVITQSAEKVSVSCKQFEVKAEETVSISSGKASTYKSDDTLTIQSAKDMTQKTDAALTIQSARDMTQKSDAKIAITGQTEVTLTGASQSKVDLAAAGATVSGMKVELTGQAQLAGKAPMVEIKADGIMNLEATGIAALKGSLVNLG